MSVTDSTLPFMSVVGTWLVDLDNLEGAEVFSSFPLLVVAVTGGLTYLWGRGNSTVVSVSIYQAGDPGSCLP